VVNKILPGGFKLFSEDELKSTLIRRGWRPINGNPTAAWVKPENKS
jgi:hypothetical protein